MEKNYVLPELELIGDAATIVQGTLGIGPDPGNQTLVGEMEFEAD